MLGLLSQYWQVKVTTAMGKKWAKDMNRQFTEEDSHRLACIQHVKTFVNQENEIYLQ